MGIRTPKAMVLGVGSALPDRVVPNSHFEAYLDTTDEWIRERTGISTRHFGESNSELAIAAARAALADAGVDPAEVALCVLATTTPDRIIPSTSSVVQNELGLRCGAFDVNAACAGFVYAYAIAASMTADLGPILVIGSEVLTRVTDQKDRQTAVLMGDGAGAVVVGAGEGGRGQLWFDLGTDGSLASLLQAEHGGYMKMNGREVFRHAVRACVDSSRRVLDAAGACVRDVAVFVPHQANLRIISAVSQRLGIDPERVAVTIDSTGNTSAASIPIALDRAVRAGRIAEGDLILMSGFGAGMTWGSILLRW